MDGVRARSTAEKLLNSDIGGWRLTELKGFGKSAVVFAGTKKGQKAAIKVFDPELVERFGKKSQLGRINRELELIGHDNKHLVSILDGGECHETQNLFVVMELHDWPSLDEVINDIPRDKIWLLIEYISDAAKYLEEIGVVHRDIKPSNIIVSPDFSDARLLDLGVIRPIGDSDLTDNDEKAFISTLRYSAPELLLREEIDSVDGWRAVTFYQIGAVLHDVIMRKRIFDEFSEPYARLVHAVDKETPHIEDNSVDPELIFLAKNCLTKKPDSRRKLVSWEDFKEKKDNTSHTFRLRHRISQRQKAVNMPENEIESERDARALSNKISDLLSQVNGVIRNVRTAADYLPPCKQKFHTPRDNTGDLLLCFDKSKKYAINVDFSIHFDIEILNPIETIVEINCVIKIDADNEEKKIYEGVFEKGVLKERVEEIFLYSVDRAQQNNSHTTE